MTTSTSFCDYELKWGQILKQQYLFDILNANKLSTNFALMSSSLLIVLYETKYSRMDQVKFVEDSL